MFNVNNEVQRRGVIIVDNDNMKVVNVASLILLGESRSWTAQFPLPNSQSPQISAERFVNRERDANSPGLLKS